MSDVTTVSAEEIASLRKLMKRYNSRYIGERLEAEREVADMGEHFSEVLVAFLRQETLKHNLRKSIGKGILFVGLSAMLLLTLYILTHDKYVWFAGFGGFGGLAGVSGLFAPSQTYMQAVNLLAEREDKRLVGYLAEAVANRMGGYPNPLRIAMARVLIRVLPQLELSDGEYLSQPQRTALYSRLKSGERNKETELILAIIEGLTRIEDVKAMPHLSLLIKKPANTQSELAVRAQAQLAFETLHACYERLEMPQTLLRASMLTVSGDELLRPAMDVSKEEENVQLLRASSNERE